jgi:hypothetical protein
MSYVESAQRFWLEVTGAAADQFRTPTLKRHNPKTVRKNTGDEYHGCLRIDVRRSSGLYRKIEGWSTAIVGGQLTLPQEGVEPTYCSRGRIRTFVDGFKVRSPARLEDPGRFGWLLYRTWIRTIACNIRADPRACERAGWVAAIASRLPRSPRCNEQDTGG